MPTRHARGGVCLLLSIAVITLQTPVAAAQTGTIRGTVTDAETGAALIGANVIASQEGLRRGASTVGGGAFVLADLPAGSWTVEITYVGYESRVLDNISVTAGSSQTLRVELSTTTLEVGETVVVTASRRPEKVMDAPVAVSVVESREISMRPAMSVSSHLMGLPGVDVVRTGMTQDRVVMRGLNGTMTWRALTLTDNRIAQMPSLRFNLYQVIPVTNEDIERIEVAYGPGSALYGPNAAGGVVHMITKSPFTSQGTSVRIAGGERGLLINSFRHAGTIGQKVGYKFSAEQARGRDWEYRDPAEPDSLIKGFQTATGRVDQTGLIPNQRDFDIDRLMGEARVDYRMNSQTTLIFSGGISRISNIELTDVGAFQAVDWTSTYLQGRLLYRDLFAQVYVNRSDAGDTFNLRSGDLLVDRSSLFVAQVQHGVSLAGGRHRLTYGADLLLTRPDTDYTLSGRNEDDDDINEVGGFLQSESVLSSKWRLIGAARIDDNNRLSKANFSPRAALIYEPDQIHNFRFTYNRAYETPRTNHMLVDFMVLSSLGPFPYAGRLRGVPATGWQFRRDSSGGLGGLYMQSIFTPPGAGGPSAYLPADATVIWDAVVGFLQTQGVDLSGVPAPTTSDVGTNLGLLNTTTGAFDPATASDVVDLPPLEPTRTTTFEVGYKGVINNRLLATINVYHENTKNLVGPWLVETPNVFFDEASMAAYLGNFMPAANAAALASSIASIPVGTITPEGADPADLVFSTRNFGELSYYGAELGLTLFANANWRFTGSYTYMSENFFPKRTGEPNDLTLNAPRFKFGGSVTYTSPTSGLDVNLRTRFVDSFPVITGLGSTKIDSYTVVDLNARYELPFSEGLGLNLSIQNLLDNRHREFDGVPEIGRLTMLQFTFNR
jgi:iron complex outermembrane receptor protein